LAAFVFMPEHVHLLVAPSDPEPEIDLYLALLKQPFSKWVKRRLLDARSSLVDWRSALKRDPPSARNRH
jgi:putative transposase